MTERISVIVIDPFYRTVRMACFARRYVGSLRYRISESYGWIDGREALHVFDQSIGRRHFSFARECVIQGPGTIVGYDRARTGLKTSPSISIDENQAIGVRRSRPSLERPCVTADGCAAPAEPLLFGWHKTVTRLTAKGD